MIDSQHIWHPYSSVKQEYANELVTSARGVYLELANGRKIIDGMASWWSVIHGYNHPKLNNAIIEQTQRMAHVMFGGLTHRPAIELTELLLQILPKNLQHIFYSDSGSVAIEVALKMAIQYWYSQAKPEKQKFITIAGGYHGDTWHAMSVCDPTNGMHSLYSKTLPQQFFAPRPQSVFNGTWHQEDIDSFETLLKTHSKDIAACVLEPIVQGAGGMYFYHQQYLAQVAALCKQYDVLLIADEIATGFGRTGTMFACEHAAVEPDILCIGKAITGGYMSFAATICTRTIAESISGAAPGVFMHGPTFMANPLACAVAVASIKLLIESPWSNTIKSIETQLRHNFAQFENLKIVKQTRTLGAIGVIELTQAVDMKTIQPAFVRHGVWVRPFGKLVYIMPPYVITNAELQTLVQAIYNTLQEIYE